MKEYGALLKRLKEEHDWLNYRSALICAVMANIWPGKRRKKWAPADFMPGHEVKYTQTADQMFAIAKLLNTALGGKVLEK